MPLGLGACAGPEPGRGGGGGLGAGDAEHARKPGHGELRCGALRRRVARQGGERRGPRGRGPLAVRLGLRPAGRGGCRALDGRLGGRRSHAPPPEAVALLWALAQLACESEPGFLADAVASVPPEALDAQQLQLALKVVRVLVGEEGALTEADRAAVGAWAEACDRTVPRHFEGGLESGPATALLEGICALGVAPEASAAFLVAGPGGDLSKASLDPAQAKLLGELRARAARVAARLEERRG